LAKTTSAVQKVAESRVCGVNWMGREADYNEVLEGKNLPYRKVGGFVQGADVLTVVCACTMNTGAAYIIGLILTKTALPSISYCLTY
jgi:hypothetical protein